MLTYSKERALSFLVSTDTKPQKTTPMNTYKFATDAESGSVSAESLKAAYAKLRSKITQAMIDDGATLWVEDANGDRLTMGRNAK